PADGQADMGKNPLIAARSCRRTQRPPAPGPRAPARVPRELRPIAAQTRSRAPTRGCALWRRALRELYAQPPRPLRAPLDAAREIAGTRAGDIVIDSPPPGSLDSAG